MAREPVMAAALGLIMFQAPGFLTGRMLQVSAFPVGVERVDWVAVPPPNFPMRLLMEGNFLLRAEIKWVIPEMAAM